MTNEVRRTVELNGGRRFRLVFGDITEEPVDAIVNAANGRLEHGGGVAAAIGHAAGETLWRESRDRVAEHGGQIDTGDAVATGAGALPQKGVIHAVGPRHGEGEEEEKLVSAVARALSVAHDTGWTSLSMPAISAGIFSVPHGICARAYVAGVRRHYEENPDSAVTEVRLCLFEPLPTLLEAVEEEMDSLEGL